MVRKIVLSLVVAATAVSCGATTVYRIDQKHCIYQDVSTEYLDKYC